MSAGNSYRPQPMQQVVVIALAANWRVKGETVKAGQRYTLDADDAATMVTLGKARRA